ncbi:MAG: discoidin domain-containing protein [Propionibacteriaceae bacterium]|jgi:hypothetical protein|nr:discoidin domain-containing protein [Propionibacteriaceae bacterium]
MSDEIVEEGMGTRQEGQPFITSKILVAFRTHVWNDVVALHARRLRGACEGLRFVVAANETYGALDTYPFEKIAMTDEGDFSDLPRVPADRVLWYNTDYPLYALRRKYPDVDFFVTVENDVQAEFNLGQVFIDALTDSVDFLASGLSDSFVSWPWDGTGELLDLPRKKAHVQVLGVSARGVDLLEEKRCEVATRWNGDIGSWPFCELFIPTVLTSSKEFLYRDLGSAARKSTPNLSMRHYSTYRPVAFCDPRAIQPGALVHPSLNANSAALRWLNTSATYANVAVDLFDPDSELRALLACADPKVFLPDLSRRLAQVFPDAEFLQRCNGYFYRLGWVSQIPQTNWALGQPARMSSVHQPRVSLRSNAEEASQGNNARLVPSSGFHTALEQDPWWEVDLGHLIRLTSVVLYHRPGPTAMRTLHLDLMAGANPPGDLHVIAQKTDQKPFGGEDGPFVFSLDGGDVARRVRVTLRAKEVFHLDEVEVYGDPLPGAIVLGDIR